MEARIELPTYTTLVGVEQPYNTILEVLSDETAQFIVSIDGLGGLGKTALADKVTRKLVHTTYFDEIAWVTAKQTHLSTLGRLKVDSSRPALTFPILIDRLAEQFELNQDDRPRLEQQRLVKQFLQQRRCLVVIDNLETMVDYDVLLPELKRWQRPSKFLLTSRLRLLDELDVFSFSLQELSRQAAVELMRLEAGRTNFTALLQASDEELSQIYDVVGGNPLAIKLVVGQARFYSLPQVLQRFSNQQQQEDLFQYIYVEAWESLSNAGKTVLLTLTEAGESGFNFEHLHTVSDLPEEEVQQALEKLILLSLVDLGGSLMERRYRLHRLTEVFILNMFV
jgi:Cdc6-like AAA superfamily ATPase